MRDSPDRAVRTPVRREITSAQLASRLDSRLYDEHLSDRDVATGCDRARHWGLASVIVRPEDVPLAAAELTGSMVGCTTVVGWNADDSEPMHLEASRDEACLLVAAGATEVGLLATAPRLRVNAGALFKETLTGLVDTLTPMGVRVRLILDTESLTASEVRDACDLATAAGSVWMAQGGSWRGRRADLPEVQLMREGLPRSVLLKWTEPVRRLETLLLCIALGIDRFNGDVEDLMQTAVRAEWLGPLTIPQAGVDF
ncbi:hypothetical protein ASD62_19340 [Phycicoccus sp. Root563]|uniref:hypothetical protein n=1 Tax=Phycicoccus sp. Root563 TaxID=1736562 RepID=UPI00070289D8|nr:hypothetical protein [Phycicoccus sp. Root563]KQZ87689.1 hypothetical protein ASD62_19340 [Phycicoccus sp. Root563]